MKTTINKKELKELDACTSGYETFIKVHGEKDAKLSECLASNGWDDVWWLIAEIWDDMSKNQQNDLHLLSCDYAESCLSNFEKVFPEDDRPRKAIEAKKKWVLGEITLEELSVARAAAWLSAEKSAWSSAEQSAVLSARLAAWLSAKDAICSSSWLAARSSVWLSSCLSTDSSARAAAMKTNEEKLLQVFLRWENK